MNYKNLQEILEVKRRRHVRTAVTRAIRSGTLTKPHCCDLCKKTYKHTVAHHIDYGKPLEVVWLCTACHGQVHRKEHPMNPRNNKQSPMPYIFDESEKVPVTILVPISSFLEMQKKAEKLNQPIARMLGKEILKDYPAESTQLEFNFVGRNDNTQQAQQPRVQSLVQNENSMHEPEVHPIQKLWREGGICLQGMDGELHQFFSGHGGDAAELQRARSC